MHGRPALPCSILATTVVTLSLEFRASRKLRIMRIVGALLCAGLLTLAAAVSAHETTLAPDWAEALLVGAVVALSLTILDALAAGAQRDDEPARRAVSAVPMVDSLTQLPTRVYFEDRLAAAATKADASSSKLALLFIDLDGFKPVNDTYGHSIGDLVLEQVGQRLKSMSRGKDVVARVGGDEFLLLLNNVSTQEAIANVADRLIQGLSHPYAAEGREVMISCSVGIAMYPDGCSHAKLIARADAAMYASKRSGGSKHCFYSNAMDADAEAQFELLRDLRKAVVAKEFELFYQPKIDAKSGKVTAVEALLRWKHPSRGLLLPSTFIPIAERFGLIGAIGNWVIEDACRQSRQWREKGVRMRVAINLSAHQMRQDDIVERITDALQTHKIHPSLLTCEITESAAMEDTKTTQTTFRRLGELGTHLVDRRLRHRLLEPQLSAQAAGRGAQDRPQLHPGPRAQRRCARRRRRRHQARPRARPEGGRGRGREPAPAGGAGQDGLRRAAGIPVRQADVGARPHAVGGERPLGGRVGVQAVAVRRDAAVGFGDRRAACLNRRRQAAAATANSSLVSAPRRGNRRFVASRWERLAALPTFSSNASRDARVNREQIMADNLFSAVLTFSLMAAGTAAVGSELFASHRPVEVATLPAVTITGHRVLPMAEVVLPAVTVTGRRQAAATVAIETSDVEQRLQ